MCKSDSTLLLTLYSLPITGISRPSQEPESWPLTAPRSVYPIYLCLLPHRRDICHCHTSFPLGQAWETHQDNKHTVRSRLSYQTFSVEMTTQLKSESQKYTCMWDCVSVCSVIRASSTTLMSFIWDVSLSFSGSKNIRMCIMTCHMINDTHLLYSIYLIKNFGSYLEMMYYLFLFRCMAKQCLFSGINELIIKCRSSALHSCMNMIIICKQFIEKKIVIFD